MRLNLAVLVLVLAFLSGCSSSEEQPEEQAPVQRADSAQLCTETQVFRDRLVGIQVILMRYYRIEPASREELEELKRAFNDEVLLALRSARCLEEEVDD